MKETRMIHGTLMYPLEVGTRALIFYSGRYIHTSPVVAIHGVDPRQIRFETQNTYYYLFAPTAPAAMHVAEYAA